MPLYSASQLIGKTIVLNKAVNVYDVFDLNNSGDAAKPIGKLPANATFVLDSFLAPTNGYTSSYGIVYAKRIYPYFTYFDGTNYNAVAVIGDGRFSLSALRDQGALTVQEEIKQKEQADMSDFEKFWHNLFGNFKLPAGILPIVLIVLLAPSIIKSVKEISSKKQ